MRTKKSKVVSQCCKESKLSLCYIGDFVTCLAITQANQRYNVQCFSITYAKEKASKARRGWGFRAQRARRIERL